MKHFLQKFLAGARVLFCTGMVMLTSGYTGFAQAGSVQDIGGTILDESTSAMSRLLTGFGRFLQVALGLGALVTLVIVIFNVFKGEREAAQKIGWWVVGLALGFTLITVVINATQGAVGV